MPHTATRIFVDGNFNPPLGITLPWDVRAVLKRGTTDVGQLYGDVDRHGNRVYKVNGMAKNKPERNAKQGVLTLADRQDNYFGLNITPSGGGSANLASFISRFASEWAYLPPRGELYDEPFRPLDFDDYYHDANTFLNPADRTFPSYTIVGQAATFRIGLNTGNNLKPGAISIDDFCLGGSEGTAFSDLYGALIFVNGNTYKILTSPYKLGEPNQSYVYTHGTEITLPAPVSSASYIVYPCLSLKKHTTLDNSDQTDEVVSLPISPFSFEVLNDYNPNIEHIAVSEADAYVGARGSYTVTFNIALGGNLYEQISQANWEIREATEYEDETGEMVATGYVQQLHRDYPQSVTKNIKKTHQALVYIKAYDADRSSVVGKAWAQVRENLDE